MESLRSRRVIAGVLAVVVGASVASEARAQDTPMSAGGGIMPPPTLPAAPPPPPPPPRPAATAPVTGLVGETTVRFEPTAAGTTLLEQSGYMMGLHEERRFRRIRYYAWAPEEVYSPICEGPCEKRLPFGEYKIALAGSRHGAAVPAGTIDITEPSILHADLVDRSGLRVLGGVIGIAGLVTGMVLFGASVAPKDVDTGLLAAGISTGVVSGLIWVILGMQKDEAHVTVTRLEQ